MKKNLIATLFLSLAVFVPAVAFNLTQSIVYSSSGFGLTNLVQTPDRIYPGDEVRLQFLLVGPDRIGGANNVALTVLSPFSSTRSDYGIGSIGQLQTVPVVADLSVPSTAKPGSYYAYVYVVEKGGVLSQLAEIPFIVNEPTLSNALLVSVGDLPLAKTGSTIDVPVVVKNVGSLPADDVIVQMQFNSANALLPMEQDRAYIASIAPGSSATTIFKVGVNSQAAAGFYPMSFQVSYKVDKVAQPAVNQTFGLAVSALSNLLITSDISMVTSTSSSGTSGSTSSLEPSYAVDITVANTGDSAIRGVYISATSRDYAISGVSDKFVGTMNLDDTATLSLSVSPRGPANGTGTIDVTVTYKDYMNAEQVQNQTVSVSRSGSGSLNFTGSNANQRYGRQASGLTIFGMDPLVIVGVIVLAVVAFFGYKWYKKRGNGKILEKKARG